VLTLGADLISVSATSAFIGGSINMDAPIISLRSSDLDASSLTGGKDHPHEDETSEF
jgi:hypothetical protein